MGISIDKIKALANKAAETDNHDRKGADFERELPQAGKTIARFVEYIELGKQPRKPWKGQAREPADEVRITFELLGTKQKNVKTVKREDGTEFEVAQRISLRMNKSMNDKASFKKLYKKMKAGRSEITNMAQMLNEVFIVTIFHTIDEETKKPKYANLTPEAGGEFAVEPPYIEDPMTGQRKTYTCREAVGELKLFLWDVVTKDTWDSLYIEGTREVKDDKGQTKTVSKNWLQGLIMSATNFKGSPLDVLLAGAEELPEFQDEDHAAPDVAQEEAAEFEEEVPAKAVAPSTKPKAAAKAPVVAQKAPAAASVAKPATKVATPAKATPKAAKASKSTKDVFANLGVPDGSDNLNDEILY